MSRYDGLDAATVHRRVIGLTRAALGRPARVTIRGALGFGLAGLVGFGVGFITRDAAVTFIVSLAVAAGAALVAWLPLADRGLRAAFELVNDHDRLERAEWQRATGAPMPRSPRQASAWLEANPGPAGARAALLAMLGRLAEAERALDASELTTPEAAFTLARGRSTIALYAGEPVDMVPLHAAWEALPETPERRHRRACLAILDAMIAVEGGGDPLEVLATARAETTVDPSMRAWRILLRWSVIGAAGVAAATAFAAFVMVSAT